MKTVSNFIQNLLDIECTQETISVFYHEFLYSFDNKIANFTKEDVTPKIKELSNEEKADFITKLERCASEAQKEHDIISKAQDKEQNKNSNSKQNKDSNGEQNKGYIQKIESVKSFFEKLKATYYEIGKDAQTEKSSNSDATVIEQQNSIIKDINNKIIKLNEDVKKANEAIDSKVFSLFINTVAILGIFVAIAFAGFGVTSIFSNIDFATSFASISNFSKSIFVLCLVAWFSYNLLLLLVYFIYKLSRPFTKNTKKSNEKNDNTEQFSNTIKLKPFVIIDVIMLILTVVLFFWSLKA